MSLQHHVSAGKESGASPFPSISHQMHQKPGCPDPIPRVLPEALLAPGSTSMSAWPSPKEDSLPLLHQLKAGNLFAFLLPVTLAHILDYSFCFSFSPLLLLAEFIQLGLSAVTLPGGPGPGGAERSWAVQQGLMKHLGLSRQYCSHAAVTTSFWN